MNPYLVPRLADDRLADDRLADDRLADHRRAGRLAGCRGSTTGSSTGSAPARATGGDGWWAPPGERAHSVRRTVGWLLVAAGLRLAVGSRPVPLRG